jgi:lysine/ornithine N-monooxygenase
MSTWRDSMPPDMILRSAWHETSLSAPGGAGSIDAWVAATGEPRVEPIPLQLFLRYSAWFAERFVANRDASEVAHVASTSIGGFRITSAAGDEVDAKALVVAVGVMPFTYVPQAFTGLDDPAIADSGTHARDFDRYAGKRVLVVGGGQAGLENAGLAARAGADVELVTRSAVHWFADREPERPRSPLRQRLYRLAYPAVGYGPPPLNRLVLYPDLFASLPAGLKERLTRRLLRPGGSPWLRPLVDGHVKLTEHTTVQRVVRVGDVLQAGLSDGSTREVDNVILACGYRFDLDRLTFFAPDVRARIATRSAWPVLDRQFRSTDPNVYFVGYPAEGRFGPISRFVLGTSFTARRVAQALGAA